MDIKSIKHKGKFWEIKPHQNENQKFLIVKRYLKESEKDKRAKEDVCNVV